MKTLLLKNDNLDKRVGLAPRYDLAEGNKRPFGLTDLKVVSPNTLKDNYIWAYSGPAWSADEDYKMPPFNWNNFK